MTCGETLALHPALFQTRHHSHLTGSSFESHWQEVENTWRIKMTSRAPFYEGVEGRLNFPEPKSMVSLSCSFSVHSGWIFFFFFFGYLCVTCCIFRRQSAVSCSEPSKGVVGIITLTDFAEFRRPPLWVGVTSNICKFLNLFHNHLMIP